MPERPPEGSPSPTDPITSERWALLEPLLDAALDLPAEEREAFAAREAGADPLLLKELLGLIRDAARVTELPLLDRTAGGAFSSLLREDSESLARALESALAGRYTFVRKLGAGGMATVYLVHDVRGDRQVALKVLHPDLSHTMGADRFAREVRLVATLDHPNIVSALDSGEADGHLWFTMPFIEGESLRQRIQEVGPLPLDEALSIFHETAAALGFAHERGVVHRDIKPDNILLSGGHAHVADFGIARALEAPGQTLTMTGMSVGTPAYMAPEQAAGEKNLTQRVDIYALGSLLYEMLAGVTAFTGATAQAIIVRAMTTDPQPIHPVRTAVTPALDAVILKAMSRTTADRYATMAEFSAAVAEAAVSTAPAPSAAGATPQRRSSAARMRAAVIGGAVLIVAGVALWRTGGSTPPRLAVLEFANRSTDTTDAYLAEGFTEEIGNRIALVPRLSVVSLAAVRRAGTDDTMSVQELGRQLGANYLMSGSVQRVGGRLRVTVELVRSASGERRWGDSYNRAESELPLLLQDIAVAAATGMLGTLDADARRLLAAPTENSAAYDLYLRGSRTRLSEGSAGLQQSVASFEGALALDPRFAAAQARLAGVYARSLFWGVALPGLTTDSVVARASMAASRALALDSTSADAWAGRGTVLFFGPDPNYGEAAAALGRAAALDSANAGVHWMRGQILRRLGDSAAAESATRAALVADPGFAQAYNQMAQLALGGRRFAEALALSDSAIALLPAEWQYWAFRARTHIAMGDSVRARESAARAVDLSPPDQLDYAMMVQAQATAFGGDTVGAARAIAPAMSRVPREGTLNPRHYQVALAQIATGQRDAGLATLERIRPRGPWLWSYLILPGFDAVRSDARFVRLLDESQPPGMPAGR